MRSYYIDDVYAYIVITRVIKFGSMGQYLRKICCLKITNDIVVKLVELELVLLSIIFCDK